jgi:hypothetical protein
MDDYLFIVLAKLKADRLKLQREQRAEQGSQDPLNGEPAQPGSRRARRFNPESEWSKSQLGEQS